MRLPLFLLLLLVSPVFAFPSLLSLDGFLTSPSGTPLNGSYSFVFSLYNVSSGGVALWTESQTLTVSSGKLNALLGSVTALTLPFDQDYYLGVKVSTDSEMSPRYRIASSAYSYTAKGLAPNSTAADNFYVSGNVDVGAGLKFGDTSSACDSSSRGMMKYVAGGAGVADGVYQCMKRSTGNYSWVLIKSGGISATGGTITEVGGYRIHTFTSSGTFTVSEGGNVEYLVVAGGGAGRHGGGGGGGVLAGTLSVVAQDYSVIVGAGGTGTSNGANSAFGSVIATGGGAGGSGSAAAGAAGGSGGGASYDHCSVTGGGAASPAGQGYPGGNGAAGCGDASAGGGGGAGGPGVAGANSGVRLSSGTVGAGGGNGGVGIASSIIGSLVYYGGGGGGGSNVNGGNIGLLPAGGNGGGGNGGTTSGGSTQMGTNGIANTGGGGGGSDPEAPSFTTGGSGIVIIRYPI